MQSAKEKVKDMASTAKAKLKECTASTEEKAKKATAYNHKEKEMIHEQAKARKAEAMAQLHHEKAEHKAETATHGVARVPLTGPHHHRPVGHGGGTSGVPPAAGTAPAHPAYPAGEKYL